MFKDPLYYPQFEEGVYLVMKLPRMMFLAVSESLCTTGSDKENGVIYLLGNHPEIKYLERLGALILPEMKFDYIKLVPNDISIQNPAS